jgi:hypothetical protein
VRVITLGVPNTSGNNYANYYNQMTVWSRESNAIVPACAFEGECGPDKCCLGTTTTDAETINGVAKQCILYYTSDQRDVSTYITQGVDALVKYGTYDVATRIKGYPIAGSSKNTSCFLKRVVASRYVEPPQEPEKSCNPRATPTHVLHNDYNDGFSNFAPGTSSVGKKGAELHFDVVAQNDNCVEQNESAQVFYAEIEVYNPTTGLLFDTQRVSIIVPPVSSTVVY